MKLVFLGPPGAGKGTQASRIAAEMAVEHASTGNIFRQAVAQGTALGKEVKSCLDAGKLVPDELTSRVVKEMVLDRSESFILDGYPRTIPQAEALQDMLAEGGEQLDAVLYYHLDEDEAVRRLTGRLVCKKCGENFHRDLMPPKRKGVCDRCGGELMVRSDSSEDIVRKRMAEYDEKTRPLVEYYEGRGLLHTVDASREPDAVTEATRKVLKGLAGSGNA